MKRWLVLVALMLSTSLPLLSAPRQMVDYDFGTEQVAWKPDGSQLALQDKHGIAIRDARNLRLLRYFPLEEVGINEDSTRRLALQAWSGDTLILQQVIASLQDDSDANYIGASDALLLSSQNGKPRTTWQGVWFSPANQTLWFRYGSHFHVFDWMNNRWFDVNLPLRIAHIDKNFDDHWWAPRITFSADGRFAADQLGDGRMRLWNVATRQVTAILTDKVSSTSYPFVSAPVAWSPNGKRVATLGEDPEHSDIYYNDGGPNDGMQNDHSPVVKIWDAQSGKLIQRFNSESLSSSLEYAYLSTDPISTDPIVLTWLDNEKICVGNQGFEVRRVGAAKGVALDGNSPVALSPDKTSVFASGNLVRLGRDNKTRVLNSLFLPPLVLNHVAWSPDGRFLSASYCDQHKPLAGLLIWNTSNWRFQHLESFLYPEEIGWTQDNRLWSSGNGGVTSWQPDKAWAQSQCEAPLIFAELTYSLRAAVIALPDARGVIQIFNNYKGSEIHHDVYECKITGKPRLITSYIKEYRSSDEIISPDGKWICFWTITDQTPIFHAYELREGGQSVELKHPATQDLSIKFSPDSRFLAWGDDLCEWPSGKVVDRSTSSKGESVLALGPNAKNVLRLAPDGVRLFNRQSRTLITLTHFTNEIADAQFSPDGTCLALARFHSVEIYSTQSGQRLATLYSWLQNTPSSGLDWLSLQPNGKIMGTPAARQQVVTIP